MLFVNDASRQYDRCPICSCSIRFWATKESFNVHYRIDRCRSCGYAFINPRPDKQFLMDYYSISGHGKTSKNNPMNLDYVLKQEAKYPNSSIDALRIFKNIDSLRVGTSRLRNTFLDVGCGYGFFSKEALGRGYDVTAIELASAERHIAESMMGQSPISTTFEDYEYSGDHFGVILMSQILEHARDVVAWVSKAHGLLAENGILVIAVPNFNSIFRYVMREKEPYICPPAHLNYFASHNLRLLLSKSGYKIQRVDSVSRIPRESFAKRLRPFGRPAITIADYLFNNSLGLIDKIGMGMMLNVYAVKESF